MAIENAKILNVRIKNKYDTYSISTKDRKIDLNKNFRSRSEVLDNINTIFRIRDYFPI